MKKHFLLAPLAALLCFTSCETGRQQDTTTAQETGETTGPAGGQTAGQGIVMEKDGLRLTSIDDSPRYPEARLRQQEPQNNANLQAGPVTFNYEITNFQLTSQTPDADHKEHANSQQGQHIHNILNNEPYTAHYETRFTKDIPAGNHVVLSFLSRSYHESLKHKGAYELVTFSVGRPAEANTFDRNGQHMFYSRPKGDYEGDDTRRVMLDFYLVNTDLSETGNRVRATINGTEFMLHHWVPYSIEGLPMGQTTIRLELLDENGNVIQGPYNTVERTITLKGGA
jgi:hypothetical protein